MHACQGTNDRQGHERIQRAGQGDTSGHLPITESRWRGSLIHGERLAWVTAQGPRTAVSSAVITEVFQTNYKRGNEFLHWLIKFAHYVTVTFEPVSDVHAHGGILTVMQTTVSDKLIMHIYM